MLANLSKMMTAAASWRSGYSTVRFAAPSGRTLFQRVGRLRARAFRAVRSLHTDIGFLFVNDGNTDSTRLVERLAAQHPGVIAAHSLAESGKAEAVRVGINVALAMGPSFVGSGTDLSAPLDRSWGFMIRCGRIRWLRHGL
jgi:hypothetical protein